MTTSPTAIIGEFVDASVRDRERAAELLAAHPHLIDARWLHGETVRQSGVDLLRHGWVTAMVFGHPTISGIHSSANCGRSLNHTPVWIRESRYRQSLID